MALHKFLKRKGPVDQVNHDFPLASPATKIRRLDADLPPIVEEEESSPLPLPNEERALVLFKPLLHSPSSYSLTLDPHLISGIRNNQFLWSKQCDHVTGSQSREKDNDELALVPWVPSPSYKFSNADDSDNSANAELMEADEVEEGEGAASMMMDIEQENEAKTSTSTIQYPGITEGFQQHCLLPQLPHTTSTPITWTR
uniref:Uncharacterized protein n=2 Tax=Cajanus cajan TaxID=3821 RepID=A0A151TKG0_CAJCA|nr:hypothetical protein KK1_023885 [Cajanus cajan]